MAKKYENDKGFLIIEGSLHEFQNRCSFGQNCDNCNKLLTKDIIKYPVVKTRYVNTTSVIHNVEEQVVDSSKYYYIAALNMLFCDKCLNNFLNNYNHDTDDNSLGYEIRHYEKIAKLLNIETETLEN